MATINTNDNNTRANLTMGGFSMPRLFMHLEGLTVLISAILLYGHISGAWLPFILLLFVPDVFMLGYLINQRVGSFIYNVGHTYVVTLSFALIAFALGWHLGLSLVLIWTAHIGMDRIFGYGFKYATRPFKETHLMHV